jgi:hypothetical protein
MPRLRYKNTYLMSGFKSLSTLLELAEASLHDGEITGVTRKA